MWPASMNTPRLTGSASWSSTATSLCREGWMGPQTPPRPRPRPALISPSDLSCLPCIQALRVYKRFEISANAEEEKSILAFEICRNAMEEEEEQEKEIYKEDSILALVKHLVEPIVVEHTNHETDQMQRRVAEQMYAVVVLYNYYLRKQFQHLEFVDWDCFCKLSVVACTQLINYVQYIKDPSRPSSNFDHYASMTEKKVREACETCEALDLISTGRVKLTELPVAKVAAFVVDTSCRNCILVYGAMTEQVFSIIEKNIDRSEPGKNSTAIEHAFAAVKHQTGIDQSSLQVADTSVVYSLAKRMTTCQLHILQCVKETTLKPNDTNLQVEWVSISEFLNSVQRPIIDSVTGEVSTSTKYLHLWPYCYFIHEWLRKNDIHVPSEQSCKPCNEKGRVTEHSTVEEITGDSRKNNIEDHNCVLVDKGRIGENINRICSNAEKNILLLSSCHTKKEDCLVQRDPNPEETTLSMLQSTKRNRVEGETLQSIESVDNAVQSDASVQGMYERTCPNGLSSEGKDGSGDNGLNSSPKKAKIMEIKVATCSYNFADKQCKQLPNFPDSLEQETTQAEGREDNIECSSKISQKARTMIQQVPSLSEDKVEGNKNNAVYSSETSQRIHVITQQTPEHVGCTNNFGEKEGMYCMAASLEEDSLQGEGREDNIICLNETSQRADEMIQQVSFAPGNKMDESKNNVVCLSETSQRIPKITQQTLEHVQCTNKFCEKGSIRCMAAGLLPWQEKTTQFLRNIVEGSRDCRSIVCVTSKCNVPCEQTRTDVLQLEAKVMHNFEEGIRNLSSSTRELEKLCKRNKWSINYVINKAGAPESGLVTATLVIQGFGFQYEKISRPTRDEKQAKNLAAALMLGYFYTRQGTMHFE